MAVIVYKWFFVSLLSLLSAHHPAAKSFHPFFISVTEVAHNSKDHTLEISVKLFADDFEKTLVQNYKQPVDLTNPKQKLLADKLVADYLQHHLSFSVDGKAQKMDYVGFEKDRESAYCYFQIDNIAAVKKLEMVNTVLHDFDKTQINIIHATVNGRRQSTKLDYPNKLAAFTW